jgi:hypothetical protein
MIHEQLALFGPHDSYSPLHDTVLITAFGADFERPEVDKYLLLNGERRRRSKYPEFNALKKVDNFMTVTLEDLPSVRSRCPFCAQILNVRNEMYDDPYSEERDWEEVDICSKSRLEYCNTCGFWQFHELRSRILDNRWFVRHAHILTTTVSKVRTFDEVPGDALYEISQWFTRHPGLYQSVNPSYLEKLVGTIFAASGHYSEVNHVGRPDDGGVDLVLIKNDKSTWLVQVKRRESPDSSEPVQTVRNLLGAMVLNDSRAGIVVSTADHFTYRAREATQKADRFGYRIDLIDRHLLDQMLSQALLHAPWRKVIASIESERRTWFEDPDSAHYQGFFSD